jgi:hypothetical protein
MTLRGHVISIGVLYLEGSWLESRAGIAYSA